MAAREKDLGPQSPGPQPVWKDAVSFRHDLFKCEISKMRKNVSYKPFEPQLEEVPHTHFFHSVDMKGRKQKYTNSVGGHFHEITVDWTKTGPDGGPLVKCGPALREVQTKLRNGAMKTEIAKIRFATLEEGVFEHDEHTHQVSYLNSEIISPAKIRAQQEEDKSKVQSMVASAPRSTAPAPLPGKDEGSEVTIEEV